MQTVKPVSTLPNKLISEVHKVSDLEEYQCAVPGNEEYRIQGTLLRIDYIERIDDTLYAYANGEPFAYCISGSSLGGSRKVYNIVLH